MTKSLAILTNIIVKITIIFTDSVLALQKIHMNTTISLFKTLDNSIKSKVFDYELFNKLNDSIKTL